MVTATFTAIMMPNNAIPPKVNESCHWNRGGGGMSMPLFPRIPGRATHQPPKVQQLLPLQNVIWSRYDAERGGVIATVTNCQYVVMSDVWQWTVAQGVCNRKLGLRLDFKRACGIVSRGNSLHCALFQFSFCLPTHTHDTDPVCPKIAPVRRPSSRLILYL